LGVTTIACDTKTAKQSVEQLTDTYKVIFYTSEIYPALKDTISRFQKTPIPCFALLPSAEEKFSEERIRELVKKATGTDLLKK
jgi:vacuolar-type H+-ATPase subunit F/Vma7